MSIKNCFKNLNRNKLLKILYFLVLASFILPVIYLSLRLAGVWGVSEDLNDKSDYILMMVECILGMIVILDFSLLRYKPR